MFVWTRGPRNMPDKEVSTDTAEDSVGLLPFPHPHNNLPSRTHPKGPKYQNVVCLWLLHQDSLLQLGVYTLDLGTWTLRDPADRHASKRQLQEYGRNMTGIYLPENSCSYFVVGVPCLGPP